MRRLLIVAAAGALALAGFVSATATSFTVAPWAYACGHTVFGNPATNQDTGVAPCPTTDTVGNATASYSGGTLTLSKAGPTADDLAAGATISGLTTLTAASADLGVESYCGSGAPRLNVVTSDGDTHFFGCLANNVNGHVNFNLTAAGDGNQKGGVIGKTVTSIDFVQDEQGTAELKNLKFEGNAAPTASPSPAPHPSASPKHKPVHLAQTGGGSGLLWPYALLIGGILLVGGAVAYVRRRS